jgi:Zn-dependent peptidase ImmA (M78 family)
MSAYRELLDLSEGSGLPASDAEPFFTALARIAAAYSELERKVLGDIDLAFPAHLLDPARRSFVNAVEEGVDLAERERRRLGLGREPVGDFLELLEHENLKVLVGEYAGTAALIGGFTFGSEWGPCLFVNGAGGRRIAEYRAAHLYAHFLRDNDPYATRVCVHGGPGATSDESEVRAEAFAGALLVSGDWVCEYLGASGLRKGDVPRPEALRAIQEYFGASFRAVLSRLFALGWLRGDDLEALARGGFRFDEAEEGTTPSFPERYVSLVIRAHRDGLLTLKELAERLHLPAAGARDLLHSYGVEAGR